MSAVTYDRAAIERALIHHERTGARLRYLGQIGQSFSVQFVDLPGGNGGAQVWLLSPREAALVTYALRAGREARPVDIPPCEVDTD